MANAHSPARFNGEADNFFDPNFTLDLNKKMRVPKSIRVSGDFSDEDNNIHGQINGSSWNPPSMATEKFDMHVPDRIIVLGQEQHIGTKAPPLEISLENSVLPKEPESVRCVTPPRVLTLDNHYFPTADEDYMRSFRNESGNIENTTAKPADSFNKETPHARHLREQTPAFGNLDVSLPLVPGEEVQQLRRQLGKLNRRIIAIESEIKQQQQRTKFMYVLTAMYIGFKALLWFAKN